MISSDPLLRTATSRQLMDELLARGAIYEVCRCGCEEEHHNREERFCHVCWKHCPYDRVYRIKVGGPLWTRS